MEDLSSNEVYPGLWRDHSNLDRDCPLPHPDPGMPCWQNSSPSISPKYVRQGLTRTSRGQLNKPYILRHCHFLGYIVPHPVSWTQVFIKPLSLERLGRVPDASAESLEETIRQSIIPGSAISTDGWKGYARLVSHGYTHDVVRKTAEVGDNLLPHCHRVASLLKRWILGTHQGAISHDHLDYYLDEYTFRFNRRTSRSRGKLFYRLVQQAVAIEPLPYKAMIETVKRKNCLYKI